MTQDSFQLECVRLSHSVDDALCERLRWERNEGPMLTHLVALANAAFEGRSEFELVEEGATRDIKRFVLKIHGNRVIAIAMRIEAGRAIVEAQALERGKYGVADGPSVAVDYHAVDEAWMAGALQELFSRVRS